MTPWEKVSTLPENLAFDKETISNIVNDGYSRYPVIGRHQYDVKGEVVVCPAD